jgi:predicted nucleic acid-binding Zn ribbon protein
MSDVPDPTHPLGGDPQSVAGDTGSAPRGADLARQALAAARARNAARRAELAAQPRSGRRPQRHRWSGAGPDRHDPAPFGALARQWVSDHGSAGDLAKATVIARWPSIVGSDLAAHCAPVDLVDGLLTVRADSTAWATQIRLLAPTLLGKIAATVGPNQVRKLRTAGPSGPSWRFGPRHVPGRGPRDTFG